MSNNHKEFQGFLSEIQLIGQELSDLRTSRDANRERISKYWRDTLGRNPPTFEEQGSFAMGTVIDPIEGDYDLDDGLYLQCISTNPEEWPATTTVQGWISSAVSGATKSPAMQMKRCVRIPYAAGYHIDIPVYGIGDSEKVVIFKKGEQAQDFEESNPLELVKWFETRKQSFNELRTYVRFFKAWRDHKKGVLSKLKSVTITILLSNAQTAEVRFDKGIIELAKTFDVHFRNQLDIYKPIEPFDCLTNHLSTEEKTKIADMFAALANAGETAIAQESVREGALIWQKQFGPRFPVPAEDTTKSAIAWVTTTEPPISTSGRNA